MAARYTALAGALCGAQQALLFFAGHCEPRGIRQRDLTNQLPRFIGEAAALAKQHQQKNRNSDLYRILNCEGDKIHIVQIRAVEKQQ